jgi:hypothetical protein
VDPTADVDALKEGKIFAFAGIRKRIPRGKTNSPVVTQTALPVVSDPFQAILIHI